MTIYAEIAGERAKQDHKWGGPRHDDTHSKADWIIYIMKHLARAGMSDGWPEFRWHMVRVAALAVASIEAGERFLTRESSDG